ncbi:MAG: hypothetical protein RQ885_08380 [Desulfurococcales archaeon]|nr:hypothetical protein [Desulfurococcales archaeon]
MGSLASSTLYEPVEPGTVSLPPRIRGSKARKGIASQGLCTPRPSIGYLFIIKIARD